MILLVSFVAVGFLFNTDGKSHEFRTLKDGRTKLVAVYEKMLEACSKQLAKMCKQEKQTWQRLDQIETDCSVLIRDLTSKAEELVRKNVKLLTVEMCCGFNP